MKLIAYTILVALFSFSTLASEPGPSGELKIDDVSFKIETYASKQVTDNPVLLITLHGDIPIDNIYYHNRLAQIVAKNSENTVAVGLLRQGYGDNKGRKSSGVAGDTVGDNYDDKRVLQIADAIAKLRQEYSSRSVILAGHSGGAAITSKIIALRPGLIDHAFLVSCPCNINAWRADMYVRNDYVLFKGDLDISSPHDLVKRIPTSTKVTLFIGMDDDVTKPYLSQEYYHALSSLGIDVDLHKISGDHSIFLSYPVVNGLVEKANQYARAAAHSDPSEREIREVVHAFGEAIRNKDIDAFSNLFYDNNVPWLGVYPYRRTSDSSANAGIDQGNYADFIAWVASEEETIEEKFWDIHILTDNDIATVHFNYSFHIGDYKSNWGEESWQLVKTISGWKINSVIYSAIVNPKPKPTPAQS